MSYSEYTEGIFDGDNLEYSDEIGGNIGIFEESDYNYFFSSSSICSYLCDYETAKNTDLVKYKGAQVVICYKRYAVIENGRITFINQFFDNDLKEVNKGFYVFTEKTRPGSLRNGFPVHIFTDRRCLPCRSDGRVEKMDRYIKYNTVSDECDDVMKALDIAKAYSLEHNTRCVVAMAVFGYDRYMDFYI